MEKVAHCMEKNKTGFLLIPQLKVNFKGIQDLNIGNKTINLMVKKKGGIALRHRSKENLLK